MKLAVCIVHNRDKAKITEELVRAGFRFTITGSTGGFLREGNTTFLVGTEADRMPDLRAVMVSGGSREQVVNVMPFETAAPGSFIPSPVKVPVGGGVMFVIDVESFHRF